MKQGNFTLSTIVARIAFLAFTGTSALYAQKATEVFLPIGQSPGLSGKYTTIGTVDSLNMKAQTMTVSDSGRITIIRFTKHTRVYIDNHSTGTPNIKGTMSYCKKGMMVEVKYIDNKVGTTAEWVKVRGKQKK